MIHPGETQIVGEWLLSDGKMTSSPAQNRIESLVSNHLQLIATHSSGWDALYGDPSTGYYWELTFPHGELQGGGPTTLTRVNLEEVAEKYQLPVSHDFRA